MRKAAREWLIAALLFAFVYLLAIAANLANDEYQDGHTERRTVSRFR